MTCYRANECQSQCVLSFHNLIHLSINLSDYSFIHPSIYPSIRPSIHPLIYPRVTVELMNLTNISQVEQTLLSTHPFNRLSLYSSIHPFIHPPSFTPSFNPYINSSTIFHSILQSIHPFIHPPSNFQSIHPPFISKHLIIKSRRELISV